MSTIPEQSITYLFKGLLSKKQLQEICHEGFVGGGADTEEVYWLNTPGPVYTTQTDNCGTGQPEAPNNVGGDEDYYEFMFKQPHNQIELSEVRTAAAVDPYGGYYFDGNIFWTNERIVEWWNKVDIIITYMIDRYEKELQLPANPHNRLYDFGKGLGEAHFFGPIKPVPENYKSALEFYQFDIRKYLEWYMEFNNGIAVKIDEIVFDWNKKKELDEKLKTFNPQVKNLIEEYNKGNNNPNSF
jgi:hypothetical protein